MCPTQRPVRTTIIFKSAVMAFFLPDESVGGRPRWACALRGQKKKRRGVLYTFAATKMHAMPRRLSLLHSGWKGPLLMYITESLGRSPSFSAGTGSEPAPFRARNDSQPGEKGTQRLMSGSEHFGTFRGHHNEVTHRGVHFRKVPSNPTFAHFRSHSGTWYLVGTLVARR